MKISGKINRLEEQAQNTCITNAHGANRSGWNGLRFIVVATPPVYVTHVQVRATHVVVCATPLPAACIHVPYSRWGYNTIYRLPVRATGRL